jgi:hypothetical protein
MAQARGGSVARYCGLNRTTVHELDPSRCGLRAGKNVKWAANELPWEGIWVFKPYHFFEKKPVDLNISKHKNETIPFL